MGLAPHVARRLLHAGMFLFFAVIAAFNGGPRTVPDAQAGRTARAREAFGVPAPSRPVAVTWSDVDAVLGAHELTSSAAAEYVLSRRSAGRAVSDSVSHARFERLGDGRVAVRGTLDVAAGVADAAVRALRAQDIRVTATERYETREHVGRVRLQYAGTGEASALARGVAAALAASDQR